MARNSMLRRRVAPVTVLLGSALLAACQQSQQALSDQQPQLARVELAPDEKLQITQAVWDDFEIYESMLLIEGAFVVSETGDRAGYTYCPEYPCAPANYVRRAIDLCEAAGIKCVLFADGREILVDYEIVDSPLSP